MLIAAPILAPFPVEDWRSNSAVVNDVRDSLALCLLGVFADLLNEIGGLIDANAQIGRQIDCPNPTISVRIVIRLPG